MEQADRKSCYDKGIIMPQQLHHFTLGSCQPNLGKDSTLISPDHFKASISSLWWMLTQSGRKYSRWLTTASCNGPQFISEEFSTFMKSNAVKHIRCVPYHPSSNGAAERFVQTFRQAMRAAEKDGHSLSHHLANFLLTYHTMPHVRYSCNVNSGHGSISFKQTVNGR